MKDPVDDLLHEAGAHWRASQPPDVAVDSALFVEKKSTRRWMPLTAAAGLITIALVAGFAVFSAEPLPSGQLPSENMFAIAMASATSGPTIAKFIVQDGTTVRATGRLEVKPEKPIRFCAPASTLLIYPLPDRCSFGVLVTGVDLSKLGSLDNEVELEGVWRSGVLEVTKQNPQPNEKNSAGVPEWSPVPCAPPAGGWQRGGYGDTHALHRYVIDEHPDQFRRPWVGYPNGAPNGVTSTSVDQVLVVEVVKGDVTAAARELRNRSTGNLCVVDASGRKSMTDQKNQFDEADKILKPLMGDPVNGIYALGGSDLVEVDLVMLTPSLYEQLAKVSDIIDIRPWLRPI